VALVQELRRWLDALGFAPKPVIAGGDGSFCHQTTFRQPFERTVLLTRARKNLRLCFPHAGPGRRVYGQDRFTPPDVYKDKSRPGKAVRLFPGGNYRPGALQRSERGALAPGRPAALGAGAHGLPQNQSRPALLPRKSLSAVR
jgi:hypothetical protein